MPEQSLTCSYTLAVLEAALAHRKALSAQWGNYSGNNPNKGYADRHAAHMRALEIEEELKRCGVIPYTEQEQPTRELNRLYPDAASRSIVEHEGCFFQIRYTPNGHSLSGRVKGGYSSSWNELTAERVEAERTKKSKKVKKT